MNRPITRREVKLRITYEAELLRQRVELLEKTRAARDEALSQQLILQTKEYDRRLENLNHAAERALAVQAQVLSRESWDTFQKEYDSTKLATAKELQSISSRSATWMLALGIGFSLLTVVLMVSSIVVAILLRVWR